MWRGGGRCPVEGCGFTFLIESTGEEPLEVDLVASAAFQAHSDYAHQGLPTSVRPYDTTTDEETEERPRLVN